MFDRLSGDLAGAFLRLGASWFLVVVRWWGAVKFRNVAKWCFVWFPVSPRSNAHFGAEGAGIGRFGEIVNLGQV